MKYVEFTGRTVEEAVENGLKELGIAQEDAEIRVIEEGKKKLFGSVKARVEIAVQGEECDCAKEVDGEQDNAGKSSLSARQTQGKGTDGERTVAFLEGLFELLQITACTELVAEGEKIEINVTAANTHSVIGKHGGTLDAIQTLAGAVANIGREEYKRVVVDCENYRENRENTLQKLADNLAEKAVRLGKKIQLEPMNPYERRIIHAAIAQRADVKTISEGKEPNRYIVIIPDDLEDEDAPAIMARGDRRESGRGYRNGGQSRGGRNDRGRDNRDRRFGGRGGGQNCGGRSGQGRRPSSGASGGTSMKPSGDFFGIFLGNSNNNDEN